MNNTSSQDLPEEEDFSMVRQPEDILPTPPLPPKPAPKDDSAELLDISDSTPGKSSDILSEAINRAVSGDMQDLQDAGWNIMDDVEPNIDVEPQPKPSKSGPRQVLVLVDSEDEFQFKPEDEVSPIEVDDSQPLSAYIPPNQLADDQHQHQHHRHQQIPESSLPSLPRSRKRAPDEPEVSLHGATAIMEPPGTLAARISSAIGRVNYFCPVVEVAKNGEPGFLQHDFPLLDVPEVPDPLPKELGEERFVSVKELAAGTKQRTIPLDEMAEFILLVKDEENNWYIPSTDFFDLVVNKIEINIITKHPKLRPLHWSTQKWMGCGILELALAPLMEEWRLVLSKMVLNSGLLVDTFPKASLLMGPDVTALLKDPYRNYGLRWVSHSLMYRNKAMQGNVRLTNSKTYGEHDLTRFGASMWGWQMVYLTGDCIFMEFLSKHPVSHRFIVGPSTVALKGGIRKPSFLVDKSKTQFTWTRTTFTPALLEPVYSLKPSTIDPPVFKGLSDATAKMSLSASQPLPSTSSSSSGPSRTLSSLSSSSSSSNSSSSSGSARPSSSAPPQSTRPAKKSQVVKKSASSSISKPKNRSARIKASKAKKSCC